MRKMRGFLIAAVVLVLAACGGKKDNSDPPSSAVTPTQQATPLTPKLHLSVLDASRMQIRTSDGAVKSDYMIITFTNMSGGKILGSPLSLPQPNPVYPFDFNYVAGYNHVQVHYMNNAQVEDATDFVPQGSNPVSGQPAYLASSQAAAAPNLIPMSGLNAVVLLAPKTGDYAPWVYVGLENADGTVNYRLYQKPVLPLKIPLAGYVSATVSTGESAADGSYAAGAAKTWDFGPIVPKAVIIPAAIMIPGVQIPDIPVVPVTPTDPTTPTTPTNFPTVITINTSTKQVTISPVIVSRKIVNLVGGAQEEVLDLNGNIIFGYVVDWEDAGTQYANYLQLPTTSFAKGAMSPGTGFATPSLVRPDKSKVYFDTTKCQVFVNGVDATQSATATNGVIKY